MESATGLKKFMRTKAFTLLILLAALIVLFTILSGGTFLTVYNISVILNAMTVVVFLTIGQAFLLILGNIDLSSGNVGTLGSICLCIAITNWSMPWWVGLLFAILIGAICGAMNAFMVNELNFQPFIATLALSSVAQGLTYVITNGASVQLSDPVWKVIGTGNIGIIPIGVIIAMVFLAVYGVILSKTQLGRSMYLCGGNKQAATLCGLNPKRYSYAMFINGSVMATLAGCMFAARLQNATVSGISQQQFSGLTAAILGGISFGGGSGNMLGCFLGLCILNCFENAMTVLNINNYVKVIFSGLLLIIALTFDVVTTRRGAKRQLKATMRTH